MFFRDSTVLRIGGAYYTLSVPFWVLTVLILGCLALMAWFIYIKRRRANAVFSPVD
jgi:hypothetical protein